MTATKARGWRRIVVGLVVAARLGLVVACLAGIWSGAAEAWERFTGGAGDRFGYLVVGALAWFELSRFGSYPAPGRRDDPEDD